MTRKIMIFNPFAAIPAAGEPNLRHTRLRDIETRMQGFLAAKRAAASADVLESVQAARDRVRQELEARDIHRTGM